jgi:LuxR family maltose regulon positive regulatory protein
LITSTHRGDEGTRPQPEQEALLVARLRIAPGEAAEVLRLLAPWREEAHVQGRAHSALEITVLQSLAYFAKQDRPRANETLLQALTNAQAEDYQRLFLDAGEAMAALLRVVWQEAKEEPLATYVHTLLRAFVQEQPAAAMHPHAEQAAASALESASRLGEEWPSGLRSQ